MKNLSRSLAFIALGAVVGASYAHPFTAPVKANLGPKTLYPTFAQRANEFGQPVGPRIALPQPNALVGNATPNPWVMSWDSTNADPNFVANPGDPELPSPLQNFYGLNQPLWFFGITYDNPYVTQDIWQNAPGAGAIATAFTAVLSANVPPPPAAATPVTLLFATRENFLYDTPGSSGYLGGVFLTWNIPDPNFAWSLSTTNLADFGVGVPLPLPDADPNNPDGALEVYIGQITGNTFGFAPFAAQLNFGAMLSDDPYETEVPGTNPSFSTELQYDDDNPVDWAHTLAELYTYDFAPPGPAGICNGAYIGAFTNVDNVYITGLATYENSAITPEIEEFDIVAVDSNDQPIPGASVTVNSNLLQSQYLLLHPQIDPDGAGPLPAYQRYIVSVKGSHWLRKNSAIVDLSSGTASGVNLSMKNGDVDGDNEIGPSDFSLLSASFGLVAGDSGYNPNADLDGDDEVGPSDFSILATNFGETGDDDLTP